jgi:hypothetical protein
VSTTRQAPAADGAATAAPVFVDATGRRRRRVRRIAVGLLAGACAYGVMVLVSLLGGPVPPNALLPLPGSQRGPSSAVTATTQRPTSAATHADAGRTRSTPAPIVAARPAASPTTVASVAPSPSPTASRHQPPGLAGKTATPGATGHGH